MSAAKSFRAAYPLRRVKRPGATVVSRNSSVTPSVLVTDATRTRRVGARMEMPPRPLCEKYEQLIAVATTMPAIRPPMCIRAMRCCFSLSSRLGGKPVRRRSHRVEQSCSSIIHMYYFVIHISECFIYERSQCSWCRRA